MYVLYVGTETLTAEFSVYDALIEVLVIGNSSVTAGNRR